MQIMAGDADENGLGRKEDVQASPNDPSYIPQLFWGKVFNEDEDGG
jgi:hypothetical protein